MGEASSDQRHAADVVVNPNLATETTTPNLQTTQPQLTPEEQSYERIAEEVAVLGNRLRGHGGKVSEVSSFFAHPQTGLFLIQQTS